MHTHTQASFVLVVNSSQLFGTFKSKFKKMGRKKARLFRHWIVALIPIQFVFFFTAISLPAPKPHNYEKGSTIFSGDNLDTGKI